MPKNSTIPQSGDIQILLRTLQGLYGVDVNESNSLKLLIASIESKGFKAGLGWNTWRRLFGFIKNEHSQSIATLNIVAEYAGFSSWVDFLQRNSIETERDFRHRYANYIAGNSALPDLQVAYDVLGNSGAFFRFLQQCLIFAAGRKDASIIQSIYSNADWFQFNPDTKETAYEEFNLHQLTGIYCFNQQTEGFSENLVHKPFALKKVLELCVNYGGQGRRYIQLLQLAVQQELFQDAEDFTDSIFAYHAYLIGDSASLELYRSKLLNYQINPDRLLPAGRIRVVQWAAEMDLKGKDHDYFIRTIKLDYKVFKDIAKHPDAFSFYLLYVIRYLYKIKRSQTALHIMHVFYPNGPTGISFWSAVIWNRLRIYLAAIYFDNQHLTEARINIDQVKPEWFDTFQYSLDMQDYVEVKKLIYAQ